MGCGKCKSPCVIHSLTLSPESAGILFGKRGINPYSEVPGEIVTVPLIVIEEPVIIPALGAASAVAVGPLPKAYSMVLYVIHC